jgi:hypothetical protein
MQLLVFGQVSDAHRIFEWDDTGFLQGRLELRGHLGVISDHLIGEGFQLGRLGVLLWQLA